MRLATIGSGEHRFAARIEGDYAVTLDAPDVGALLSRRDWREHAAQASGPAVALRDARFLQLVAEPSKVLCVGLNYRDHIEEVGLGTPEYPTLFAKFADTLLAPNDDLELPGFSHAVDWEAELTVVIGTRLKNPTVSKEVAAAIAGFTIANDISMRDMQQRTEQWLQGKMFDRTTPVGPSLVTPDELPGGLEPDLAITCNVSGEIMQQSRTSALVFSPVELVTYISQIVTLRPGDLILTGTPGGVGAMRTPPRFLAAGDVVTTEIEHIGSLRNEVVVPRGTHAAAHGADLVAAARRQL